MPQPIKRVNATIQKTLGEIILKEVECPPELWATISKVDTAPDLKECTVFLSVIPYHKCGSALNLFNRHLYRLQSALNKKLRIRYTPKIRFAIDDTEEKAEKIEKLIAQTK